MDKHDSTTPISIKFGSAIFTCSQRSSSNDSKRKKFTFPITEEELSYLRSINENRIKIEREKQKK